LHKLVVAVVASPKTESFVLEQLLKEVVVVELYSNGESAAGSYHGALKPMSTDGTYIERFFVKTN